MQAAVSYYGEFTEEVDDEIAANEADWAHGFEAWEAGRQAIG